jgi:hypothetical protein
MARTTPSPSIELVRAVVPEFKAVNVMAAEGIPAEFALPRAECVGLGLPHLAIAGRCRHDRSGTPDRPRQESVQYGSWAFTKRARNSGLVPSMGGGNNLPMTTR